MNDLLGDQSVYKEIPDGSKLLKRLMDKNRRLVKKLAKNQHITERESHILTNNCPTLPRIYGVLKDHKTGAPLRPVVSTIDAPSAALAKHINEILKNVMDREKYNIPNSYIFKQKFKKTILRTNDRLFSFDVKSLFTSVSLEKAI